MSPALTGLLAALGDDVDGSPMAVKDREHLVFLDTVAPHESRGSLMAALQAMQQHAGAVYGLLDGLVGLEPEDPQVSRAATALAALLPDGLASHVPGTGAHGLTDVLYEDLDPAQAAAVRSALELVKQRQEARV
ncbi:hypothetical protein ACIHFB_42685 [Streptomyces sp. NPDC051963]|uniref:hypothetical protein n=1 Tax=Streptomyces sp. NPDC051963 TaxID=3365678 RepID=UPI0037D17624